MSSIADNLKKYQEQLKPYNCLLVAVSKTKPNKDILEAYNAGQRAFGENKVQELTEKHEQLPQDIEWHMIGHLQRNKVKYIAPFVHLIHSVDSLRLLTEINKQGSKNSRVINCLLQVHIAAESTKFGFSIDEIEELINSEEFSELTHINVTGLMGMATNTDNEDQIRSEFSSLRSLFSKLESIKKQNINITELSIGMSSDYKIALECGSTMIRIGSSIFGARNYT